jgi:hypothetical protein
MGLGRTGCGGVLVSQETLTPEELELVRQYVEFPAGLEPDEQDVRRARLAQAAGGRYRKAGPGLYEIVTTPREQS